MNLSRRSLLALAAPALWAAPRPGVHLIAHRGGVVDERRAENSRAAILAALEQGYWMLEVDIWRTRDGVPVLHHDATLQRYYNDPRRVADLTWDEFRALRARTDGAPPLSFDECCALISGKARLMLDVKGGDHPDAFYASLEESLTRHGLLRETWTLGADRMKPRFWGKIWMSANRQGIRAAAARGEAVGRHYFCFELGRLMDDDAIALCRQHNVTPVAALNTFRYHEEGIDPAAGSRRDAERLLRLGVRHFQIDSIYAPLFS